LVRDAPHDCCAAESLYVLVSPAHEATYSYFIKQVLATKRLEKILESVHCLRCNRTIEPGQKSVALYMFAQTVGVKPRQKSTAHRISFCPQCSVSLAMGPPPEGALNVAAWDMIRDLVAGDPALNRAAWESLSGVLGLLAATGSEDRNAPAQGAGYFEF